MNQTETRKATDRDIRAAVLEWQRAWSVYTSPGPMQFQLAALTIE